MKLEMHSAVIAKYSKNREKKESRRRRRRRRRRKNNRRLSPHLLAGEGERNRNNFLL
jgi:hypothetical protein